MTTELPPPKVPDPKCKHESFRVTADVNRLAKSDSPNAVPYIFTCEIDLRCEQCGGSFSFEEIPWAITMTKPCVSVTGTQVTLPVKPWAGGMFSGRCVVEVPS